MKMIVMGPAGKMGKAMVKSVYENPNVVLIGAVGSKGRDYISEDIGLICNLGKKINILIHDSLEEIINECDIILDCTKPEVSMTVLKTCVKYKKAYVCGTTGFNNNEKEEFKKAGTTIPVMLASNTSKMINVLFKIINEVTSRIGQESDIDIIDMHDNKKLDAPSGTAKEISEIISQELNYNSDNFTYGRNGKGIRKEKSIAFNSIRSGGNPGSIKVIFGFEDERMELSAHIYNMNTFARGMVEAGMFLQNKQPNLYKLADVFNI